VVVFVTGSADHQSGSLDDSQPGLDPVDPATTARVGRLLRWYPQEWKARYGSEFESLLYSTIRAGNGGLKMSFNVAKEGLLARALGSGVLGTVAPPLKRARASVAEIFVGIVGFLTAATMLSHYVEQWRTFPTSAALERAQVAALHIWRSSPLATQAGSLSPAQRYAAQRSYGLEVHQLMSAAYAHQASGPPVAFDQIARFSLDAVVVGLAAVLLLALIGGITSATRRNRVRLVLPVALLVIAGGLWLVHELVPRSPWWPYGFSLDFTELLHGHTWAWGSVAYSLSAPLAVVALGTGGAILLSRADLGLGLCRWIGRLAVGVTALLGVALAGIVVWALTLSSQAPGFLYWGHVGLFGTSLFSVFLAAIVAMACSSGLAIAGCTRCSRAAPG
jgi:hypothetical protein